MTLEKFITILNLLKIVPRILVLGYAWLIYNIANWFMKLEAPTTTQAAFIATMVGVSAAIFALYMNSG